MWPPPPGNSAEPVGGEQYREFVPDVTSTDAGDAASAAEQLSAQADLRIPDTAPTTTQTGHDPWTVTSVVVAAVLIAGCVAAALAAIVPSRTDIPGLPSAGTVTDLLLPAVKAIFDLSAALTVGWLLAAASPTFSRSSTMIRSAVRLPIPGTA